MGEILVPRTVKPDGGGAFRGDGGRPAQVEVPRSIHTAGDGRSRGRDLTVVSFNRAGAERPAIPRHPGSRLEVPQQGIVAAQSGDIAQESMMARSSVAADQTASRAESSGSSRRSSGRGVGRYISKAVHQVTEVDPTLQGTPGGCIHFSPEGLSAKIRDRWVIQSVADDLVRQMGPENAAKYLSYLLSRPEPNPDYT